MTIKTLKIKYSHDRIRLYYRENKRKTIKNVNYLKYAIDLVQCLEITIKNVYFLVDKQQVQ